MTTSFPARAALAALVLLLAAGPAAAAGRGYLNLGGGFKTGDFGTPVRTSLGYVTATIGYASPTYDVSVSLPWLRLSDGTTASGPGDVILRGGGLILPDQGSGLSLDGYGAVKLPTADETKGLGSGETDFGAFLGLHQRSGSYRISLLSGYIWTGDPPGADFRNTVLFGIGLAKIFLATQVAVSYVQRQAIVPGITDPREFHASAFHVLNRDYAVRASCLAGLNNGAPDYGFETGIVRWF